MSCEELKHYTNISSENHVAGGVTEDVRCGMGMQKGAPNPHGFREKLPEENDRNWAMKDELSSAGETGERVLCAEEKSNSVSLHCKSRAATEIPTLREAARKVNGTGRAC